MTIPRLAYLVITGTVFSLNSCSLLATRDRSWSSCRPPLRVFLTTSQRRQTSSSGMSRTITACRGWPPSARAVMTTSSSPIHRPTEPSTKGMPDSRSSFRCGTINCRNSSVGVRIPVCVSKAACWIRESSLLCMAARTKSPLLINLAPNLSASGTPNVSLPENWIPKMLIAPLPNQLRIAEILFSMDRLYMKESVLLGKLRVV